MVTKQDTSFYSRVMYHHHFIAISRLNAYRNTKCNIYQLTCSLLQNHLVLQLSSVTLLTKLFSSEKQQGERPRPKDVHVTYGWFLKMCNFILKLSLPKRIKILLVNIRQCSFLYTPIFYEPDAQLPHLKKQNDPYGKHNAFCFFKN